MGGNAFPKLIAQRLTTAQLHLLLKYVSIRLSPSPFASTTTYRFPHSKTTHGDLDVLCAWEGGIVGVYPKGQELLVLDYERDDLEKREGLAGFMVLLGKMLGGREIRRSGFECSVRVPCWRVFPDEFEEMPFGPEEPFYQIDLLLLPPRAIEFSTLTTSYGLNLLILSSALRVLSPSLTLHMDCLTIRHLPYPGLPPLIVQLTHSAPNLAEWLGLEYASWLETQFETDEKGFEWMVDVGEETILGGAYKRMSERERVVKQIGHSGKAGGLDVFREWLKNDSKWRVVKDEEEGKGKGKGKGEELPSTPKRKGEMGEGDVPDLTLSPSTTSQTTTKSVDANIIDPERPNEINRHARDALIYWGKEKEWDELMQGKKEEARVRSESQRRKIESRRRALLETLDEVKEFELGEGLGKVSIVD